MELFNPGGHLTDEALRASAEGQELPSFPGWKSRSIWPIVTAASSGIRSFWTRLPCCARRAPARKACGVRCASAPFAF